MKPKFALSLSVEGIQLLHRAAGGWRLVGNVGLDAADLTAELAILRGTATAIEPGGLFCKLIIPNDQVRYLSVPIADDEDATTLAERSLDGATPYAVSDLAFDTSQDGDTLHIAAVARETLAEAEAFATEHRFNPVSFVGMPGDADFLGEPWFGAAHAAETLLPDTDTVEPDGVAVVVIGKAEIPPEPVLDVVEEDPVKTPPSDIPDAPEAAVDEESGGDVAEAEDKPLLDPAPVVAGFTSRRGKQTTDSAAPVLGGVSRRADTPIAPDIPIPPPEPEPEPEPKPEPLLEPFEPEVHEVVEKAAEPLVATRPPAPDPPPAAPRRGLFGRKRGPETIAAAVPMDSPEAESARMTVFGERSDAIRGKPRYLGLILTALLVLVLAGVAAWASMFLDKGVAGLFQRDPVPEIAAAPRAPEPDDTNVTFVSTTPDDATLSDTDTAVLDALREPLAQVEEPETAEPEAPLTPDEAEARYAVTGIWQMAPDAPQPTGLVDLDDLYIASIDRPTIVQDAIALPQQASLDTDLTLDAINSPAAAGTAFALDPSGLVLATPDGALTPDGVVVYLGRPAVVPPSIPQRDAREDPTVFEAESRLAKLRPKLRPADLVEQNERSTLGGLTRTELSGLRPKVRPLIEKTIEEEDETPTAQAIAASRQPRLRPSNMAAIVKRATRSNTATADGPARVETASAAAVAPRVVTPRIPSSASVSKQATVRDAINLRKVNLIGVYGTPSSRRALIRLSNGRYQKVKVGDRIDGGKVSAIGDSELRYQKKGRNLVIKMPKG